MARPTTIAHSDPEVLGAILAVFAPAEPHILDCTHRRGAMWQGLPYRPYRTDLDPTGELLEACSIDKRADFRCLPFPEGTWQVVVFDPPHSTENGRSGLLGSGSWADRYGTDGHELTGANICALFPPFLAEAWRILEPDGLVVAKIADLVHRNRFQWQSGAFINAGQALGFRLEEIAYRLHPPGPRDPKWRTTRHLRNAHCPWVVLRKPRPRRAGRALLEAA